MKLLVTGGAGFIGSRIVARAVAAGHEVRVLDDLRADVHGDGPPGAGPAHLDGVEFVRADLRDVSALAGAVRGVDAVCHQAAKVGLGVDFADAPDYVGSNACGTATLLAAMAAAEVGTLVLASSMVVYGEGRYVDELGEVAVPPRARSDLDAGRFEPISPRTGEPLRPVAISEDAVPDPRNVYAVTKLTQEQLSTVWSRETGGSASLLRYHNVYGPGMPAHTPYAGVASLFRSALDRGEVPRVFEDGAQRRDFIHVEDVAAANLAALDRPAAPGTSRAFNVATGVPRTIGDLAAALCFAYGAPAPEVTGEYRLGDVRHITASNARITEELDWRPEIDFADGVREFARSPLRGRTASGPVG